MQATQQKVVTIDYTLKNDAGEVLDTSANTPGLSYLHGAQNIIPGLESAIEGKQAGDELSVSIQPEDAYGHRNDELVQSVPKEMFKDAGEPKVGMQYHAMGPNNQPIAVTVLEVNDDQVVIDGNHALAGQTLHFDVKVTDVRDATESELQHGHVHGEGCDH